MLDPAELKKAIEAALPGCQAQVRDTTGTGDHFEATVVAPSFVGKGMVEQHQMVYAPLQALMASGALHALALKTYTPEAWPQASQPSNGTKRL